MKNLHRYYSIFSYKFTQLIIACTAVFVLSLVVKLFPISQLEIALFRLINHLPGVLYLPLVIIMQAGAYFSILIFATIAFVFKKRFLAAELLFGGTLAWILAWAIKLAVVRPRPFEVLSQVSLRESNVYGFGFPSAHAAVAAALVAVASFHFKSCYSWLLWVAVLIVAFARIYMGVHLPLDVAGGVALGWFAGLFTQLIFKSTRKSD